jgi:hypothetical protein
MPDTTAPWRARHSLPRRLRSTILVRSNSATAAWIWARSRPWGSSAGPPSQNTTDTPKRESSSSTSIWWT